jgi:outer membrane protein assembly factor BamB
MFEQKPEFRLDLAVGVGPHWRKRVTRESKLDMVKSIVPGVRILVWAALLLLCRPAAAWQTFVEFQPRANGELRRVTSDSLGDALAVGTIREFTAVKFDGANGTEVWRQEITGTAPESGFPAAVSAAANGDALAAGSLVNLGTARDFVVVRLAAADGSELWRLELNGTSGVGDMAHAVAVDASGDIVAAGRLDNTSTFWDFTVVKAAGSTGAELWRYEMNGTAGQSEEALAVRVDAAGDVVAAGYLWNSPTGADQAIAKLRGSDGGELWRTEIVGTGGGNDQAGTLFIDPLGDILVGGFVTRPGTRRDLFVAKLSGLDGSVLWSYETDGGGFDDDEVLAVRANSAGTVFAAGRLVGATSDADLAVIALDGSNGSVLWTYRMNGRGNGFDEARALELGPAEDPIVGGVMTNPMTLRDLVVARLNAADGSELWRRESNGIANLDDELRGMAVGPGERVFASGTVWRSVPIGPVRSKDPAQEAAIFQLEADAGDDLRMLSGRRFILVDKETRIRTQRLVLISRDKLGAIAPVRGSASDPRLVSDGGSGGGGTLALRNPTTGETDVYPLPAKNWHALGAPRRPTGFRYSDPALADGPCRTVVVRTSNQVRVVCAGDGIKYTLDEPTQGALAGIVSLGQTPVRYCTEFGGTVVRDRQVRGPAKPGAFKARKAPPPQQCVPVTP